MQQPAIRSVSGNDGAISGDGQILGTYWHGLFEASQTLHTLLNWVNAKPVEKFNYQAFREQQIDRLAMAMEQHLDIKHIMQTIGL